MRYEGKELNSGDNPDSVELQVRTARMGLIKAMSMVLGQDVAGPNDPPPAEALEEFDGAMRLVDSLGARYGMSRGEFTFEAVRFAANSVGHTELNKYLRG